MVTNALSHKNVISLFPITCAFCGYLQSLSILVGASLSVEESGWYWIEGIFLFILTTFNVGLNIVEQMLLENEMKLRVEHVVNRLHQVKDHINWSQSNYPHLHTPLANSIILQWTIRDKKQVNLPWALLVEKDLILIKPGQTAPGLCHSFDDPAVVMKEGNVLHVETHSANSEISPTPEFKSPVLPQLFVMDETPYVKIVKKSFGLPA